MTNATVTATALRRIPARRQWLRLLMLVAFLATALALQQCGGLGGAFAPKTAHAQGATPEVSAGYVYVRLWSSGRLRITNPSGSNRVSCSSTSPYLTTQYAPGNWTITTYRGTSCSSSPYRTYTVTMPTASLTASDVGNTTATLSSNVGLYGASGKTGYLYYQADAGPDASCLRASSNTVSLSRLTAGETYTYSAYNHSSCSGTGRATATFTTVAAAISPAVDNLRVQVRSDYTLTLGGAAGDVYTVEPLPGTTMTYEGAEYTATYPLTYTMQSESDALSISLLVNGYSRAGVKVTDAQNQEAVMEKILGYPAPAPSPTVSTGYATEVKLHVTGGLAQVAAVYRGKGNREYRLELRDPGTQATLSSRTLVISGSDYTYVSPVVFAGLQAGRLYGVCLTVYGGDSLSAYNDRWLCYTARTELATPEPIRPTPVPPTAVSANPTETPLPMAAPGNLFGVPTATPEPPPPPTSTVPAPTPTTWPETLIYTNTMPVWETQGLVEVTGDGEARITVQWSPVTAANYFELFIVDGHQPARIENTANITLRQHSWLTTVSSQATRVRVRAVQQGNRYTAKVNTAYGNRVVIPAGQNAYSALSEELLVSTSVGYVITPLDPATVEPPPTNQGGGALRDVSLAMMSLVGAPPTQVQIVSLTLWLVVSLVVMALAMGGVGKATGGIIGPWPFAAGALIFFLAWTGLGGVTAGIGGPERYLPPALLGFLGFVAIRGRGWLG